MLSRIHRPHYVPQCLEFFGPVGFSWSTPFHRRARENLFEHLNKAGDGAAVDVPHLLLPPHNTSLGIPPEDPGGLQMSFENHRSNPTLFSMKKLRFRVGSDWPKVTQQVGSRTRTGLTTVVSRSCSKAVSSLTHGSELPGPSHLTHSLVLLHGGSTTQDTPPRTEVHGGS